MPEGGVIIKLRVDLGRHITITTQNRTKMMSTWRDEGYDSAYAPAGVIGLEENCISDPLRIEVLGCKVGWMRCKWGTACTRPRCQFDHPSGY
jgi:hypothetical protein